MARLRRGEVKKSWLQRANEDAKEKGGERGAGGDSRTDTAVDENQKATGKSCSKAAMWLTHEICAIYLLPTNSNSISREFCFSLLLGVFFFYFFFLWGDCGSTEIGGRCRRE